MEQPPVARPWDPNVYLADASVYPTSTAVNPHWTVMAIADLAAARVAES